MTYREKLAKEHPEELRDDQWGGCNGCPSSYGYESYRFCCDSDAEACANCWDREIPEEKPAPTYPVEKATDGYIDPIHITIRTNLVDDPDAVIAEVFKYVYTIKDRVVKISIQ